MKKTTNTTEEYSEHYFPKIFFTLTTRTRLEYLPGRSLFLSFFLTEWVGPSSSPSVTLTTRTRLEHPRRRSNNQNLKFAITQTLRKMQRSPVSSTRSRGRPRNIPYSRDSNPLLGVDEETWWRSTRTLNKKTTNLHHPQLIQRRSLPITTHRLEDGAYISLSEAKEL